jgi:N-acyl-phosphatidylethanolamine-hydrolysing phospholipase D
MGDCNITRRAFFKGCIAWSKVAVMLGVFPSCAVRKSSTLAEKERLTNVELHGLSLRDIARKKLHHGDDCYLNLFGGPTHVNYWPIFFKLQNMHNPFVEFYPQERIVPVSIDWEPVKCSTGLSITFIKHACVMIKDLEQYILVDPLFFHLPYLTDFTPLTSDIKEMPRPDHVLVTHGHRDHMDEPSLASLERKTHVITPLGYERVFKGLAMDRRTQMDWFDTFNQDGREITLLPCKHWTMRNPFRGTNRSLWGSFLIKTASGPTIYISGDTGYFWGFREIGEEYSIDLAIFNLSAYEPRSVMSPAHVNPRETVKAFQELRAKHLLIVHWGSFRLGYDPVHFPPIDLQRELQNEGLIDRLVHLTHGQTLFYDTIAKLS